MTAMVLVAVVAEGVVEYAGVQPTGSPSKEAASLHMALEAPITGQAMFSGVACPAQAPGLLGSQAVHSQKPKVLTDGVKITMLGLPVASEPKLSEALRQQALAFHMW